MAIALRHAKESIPPPSRHVPSLSSRIDGVVRRATHPDPVKRYPNIAALAADLRAAVPEGPSPVSVPTLGSETGEHTLVIPAAAAETVVVEPDPPRRRLARLRRRPRTHRPYRRPSRRALVALFVALLVAGGGYGTWATVLAPPVQVPSVTGMSLAEAAEQLTAAGLALSESDPVHDREVPAGVVLAQDPAGGDSLRRGQAVTITLSLGPATVRMPDVGGRSLGEAEEILGVHAFEVEIHQTHHDTAPAGQVIGQRPEPDTEITETSEVVLQVSLGIEQVTVPDLSGLSRDEAEEALAEAKLTWEVTEEWSDEVPTAGEVISQSIEPEATVDKGTTVEVVVSRGALTIQLPNLRGRTVDAAIAELQALSLRWEVTEIPRERVGPFVRGQPNRVEEHTPSGGAQIERGEVVRIWTYADD